MTDTCKTCRYFNRAGAYPTCKYVCIWTTAIEALNPPETHEDSTCVDWARIISGPRKIIIESTPT